MKRYLLKQLKLLVWQVAILGGVSAVYLVMAAFMPADVLAFMYAAYVWGMCPLLGGWVTLRAAMKGMQAYLAMWALPLCPAVVQRMVASTNVDMLVLLIYALIGLVCAAAGEELRRRKRRSRAR